MLSKGAETLPTKAAHDYKNLAKAYDAKNYKKGLKNTQKLLQSHPDHPETISMRALFESALGDDDKAQQTAKLGLMKSKMQSMFCWHTLGTIHKQKKNFFEAAKSFQNALKFEKDNMQILRQTAALQIQVRDHVNHVTTRRNILQLKPNMIANWVAYAISQHLKGDFEQLYKALSSIQGLRLTLEMKPTQTSHYFLYRILAFREGGNYQMAIDELKKNKQKILDAEIWEQQMYKCHKNLNKKEQAQQWMQTLLKRLPQNTQYIQAYKTMLNMRDRQFYKHVHEQFKSKISKIFEIAHIEDASEFKKEFSQFIKPYYKKNLISLFAEIQTIYKKEDKVKLIEEVFLSFEESLKDNKYPDGEEAQSPSEYLWSIYHLSQHFSINFNTLEKARQYIEKAIVHTNTVSQFYMTRADIEYKMHYNFQSLKTINEARKTDLADRYMNNICVQYLMKCRKPGIAEDILKLFMRDQASLYELQNQWYIIQAGKSFLKQRNFEPGLKHLNYIDKQFKDMEANQYDFHTYCIRKWTLREYVEYIEFNDNIYKDKKYVEAAAYAMAYLTEYSHYILSGGLKKEEEELAKTQEEARQEKEKDKKKKKKKKKQEVEEELPAAQAFRKKIDYYGKEYKQKIKADPMKQAESYAKNIANTKYVNKGNAEENKLYCNAYKEAINIFIYFKKPLLALKCLKKLLKTNYNAHEQLLYTVKAVVFLQKVLSQEKTDILIKEVTKQYLFELKGNKTINEWAEQKIKTLPKNVLSQIKKQQTNLALSQIDSREEWVNFYQNKLSALIAKKKDDKQTLQNAFYIVHKLQFYGEFLEQEKVKLNGIYKQKTSYFTNWVEEIDKLPQSTWTIWWLSEYDQKREEKQKEKEEQQMKEMKEKKEKENQTEGQKDAQKKKESSPPK